MVHSETFLERNGLGTLDLIFVLDFNKVESNNA